MDPPNSLCPGYRQVDSFGPDDEYEDEEEVFYVTLDMGNVEPTLVPSSTSYRLIGLDTPTPYIQLQGTILKGRHDLLLGTEMIFTDDKESHDWTTRSVVHVGNTEQRIAFQEVTLIPKVPATTSNSTPTSTSPAADTVKGTSSGANPNEITTASFEPPARTQDERTVQIDRMTGMCGPPPRAPRSRKSTSTSTTTRSKAKKNKGKGKEIAMDNVDDDKEEDDTPTMSTRSQSAKGKGKAKESEPPQHSDEVSMSVAMDVAHDDDDDDDDMYVDE